MPDESEWSDVRLWDVGEGVCCAAFQLGACPHTEVLYEDDDEVITEADWAAGMRPVGWDAEQERASRTAWQIGF